MQVTCRWKRQSHAGHIDGTQYLSIILDAKKLGENRLSGSVPVAHATLLKPTVLFAGRFEQALHKRPSL